MELGSCETKEHTRVRVVSLQFSSDMSRPQIKSAVVLNSSVVSDMSLSSKVVAITCLQLLKTACILWVLSRWGEESVGHLLQNVSSYCLCCRSKGLAQRRDKSLRWKIKSCILPWYRMVYFRYSGLENVGVLCLHLCLYLKYSTVRAVKIWSALLYCVEGQCIVLVISGSFRKDFCKLIGRWFSC